jgi:hypothetical protein
MAGSHERILLQDPLELPGHHRYEMWQVGTYYPSCLGRGEAPKMACGHRIIPSTLRTSVKESLFQTYKPLFVGIIADFIQTPHDP